MRGNKDFYHTGLEVSRSAMRGLLDSQGPGDNWFVDYRKGSDTHDGSSWKKALRTYSEAIRRVKSNNNDIINIDGDSEIVETAMVTLSKNRVHTVGWNGALGHAGAGARIGLTGATGAIATFKNSGVRNTFTGVKFTNSDTVGDFCVWETGEYARYRNCEIQKLTRLDEELAADLKLTADSAQFYDCSIGVSSLQTVGAKTRPNVLVPYLSASQRTKDGLFQNCIFPKMAGHVDARFIYIEGAASVERWLIFKECIFINSGLALAIPAEALAASAAQTHGVILMKGCTVIATSLMREDAIGAYVDGAVPSDTTTGVALA